MTTPHLAPDELPSLKEGVRRALPGLIGVVGVVALLGAYAQAPLTAAARAFVAEGGLPGVFAACVALDSVPGVGAQPVIMLGWIGGLGFVPVLLAAGSGGVVAGGVSWGIGRGLGRIPRARRWFEEAGIGALLRRYGGRAVFAAAILPFPFALTTLAAGATGMPLSTTLWGSLGRFPKALLNLATIAAGWSLAG